MLPENRELIRSACGRVQHMRRGHHSLLSSPGAEETLSPAQVWDEEVSAQSLTRPED